MELRRGMRDRLEKYIDANRPIEVEMQISGASIYDFCCFGVDANDKLSDDKYMVFYNQTSSPAKVSLEKKLEKAPQLVSLAKTLTFELERQNLLGIVAKVALVMDISGSMDERYSNGTVQQIVNKILPLAVQFDDGELDFWYYGSRSRRMESVNLDNYTTAVPNSWKTLMGELGYGTNAVDVMNEVIREYYQTRIPAYVIFVTDSAFVSPRKVKELLRKVSTKPIFWQFVGVGGGSYGVLKKT